MGLVDGTVQCGFERDVSDYRRARRRLERRGPAGRCRHRWRDPNLILCGVWDRRWQTLSAPQFKSSCTDHFHATTKPTAPCHSPVVRFSHHRPGTPLWPGSATHRKMRWVNPATDDDFVAWSFSLQLAQKMRSHFRCVHWSVFRAPDLLLPVRLLAPCRHPQRYDWNHGFRAAPVVVAAGHPAYVIGSGRSKQASKNTCWRTHRLQHHSLHLC